MEGGSCPIPNFLSRKVRGIQIEVNLRFFPKKLQIQVNTIKGENTITRVNIITQMNTITQAKTITHVNTITQQTP